MSTLSQVRSRIADDLNRDDLSAQITTAIQRAILFYESERFWFSEKKATFSTVASQEAYGSTDGIPTDIGIIDLVQVTISSLYALVHPKPYTDLQFLNSGRVTSDPYFYSYYQENFFFAPIPSQIRTITVSYSQKYTTLSADSDTNDFTVYAEDLIEARARWWLYTRILQDFNAASMAKQEEMDALKALRTKTINVNGSGLTQAVMF